MTPEPPHQVALQPIGDSVARGCAMGCGWGIAAIAVSGLLAYNVNGKASDYAFVSCGLIQWIGIVPSILHQRKRGYRKSVIGMIVSGCIGLLLASACASMLSQPMNFR